MLAVALPRLRDDFGVSAAAVGWLVSGYLVAMAVVQPPGGRFGDELGRARIFRAGLVAFLVSSIGAAASPTFAVLVVFRTLQAISGAILIPNGMAMLRAAAPPEQFGRFAGLNGAVIGASAAAGPLLGGGILWLASWHWIFLANLPVVLIALAASLWLPQQPRRTGGPVLTDWSGLALFAGLLLLVTASLNQLRGGLQAFTYLWVAATVAVGVLFAAGQVRSRSPAASWSLFRDRSFLGASTHILLMNLAMYTTLLAVPFFITDIQGRDAAIAGVLLSAMALLQAVSAPFMGRASDAVGRRAPAVVSSVMATLASVMLVISISSHANLGLLVVPVALLGLAVGIGFVSATAAAVESVPLEMAGSAAGTQSMMRYVGSIVGSATLAGLLTLEGGAQAGIGTFRLLFLLVAAVALLSLVSAAAIRPRAHVADPRPAGSRSAPTVADS